MFYEKGVSRSFQWLLIGFGIERLFVRRVEEFK
jgi:hypothetical protein